MAFDIKKLDERIEKLKQLRAIASDPEMAYLLQEFVSGSGNGNRHLSPLDEIVVSNDSQASNEEKGLTETVHAICQSTSGKFTVRDVREKMQQNGFIFVAKNPDVAIGTVLRRMESKGTLKIVVHGAGRRPNMFEMMKNSARD